MTKTLAQIQKQIAKLQQEAESLKAKEVDGVVARVKDAIEHYGLKPRDLFGQKAASAPKRRKVKSGGKKAGARKTVSAIKFRDDAGNAWTGRGRRPNWYLKAIAGGKTPDDLKVRS